MLAVFLPVLAGQSGNTGCQAMAVALRGLTLGELKPGQGHLSLVKEAALGLANGMLVGLTAGAGMLLYATMHGTPEPPFQLAAIVFIAMTFSCFLSGVSGVMVPLTLKKLGFDPATARPTPPDGMRPPAGLFVLATLRGAPVGCGALLFRRDDPPEIKRMWVDRSARGLGVGRRLLGDLEQRAAAAGCTAVRLDTNRTLGEAIAMYRSSGYVEVPAFNDEPYAHHWFEKRL